ncbi:MAG: LysM peptidoglycan-binding domain-containing protein [Ruminococcaceae bacterium]|nr:LysM peptidoglycan-binding domain-containing protein [Oscillospiraceae bacterium]
MKILKPGSRGTDVYILQLALNRAGYLNEEPDGIFGARTTNAVLRFQGDSNLKQDGIAGVRTWNALLPYLKGYKVHRVVRGDTLWKVSQIYNTSVNSILLANPNINPENLRVGSNIVVPLGFSVVPTNVPYTYQLVSFILEGLEMRFPFLSGGVIGQSVMGKNIPFVKIGNGQTELFYNASHHANEWLTTPVLLKFLEDYAENYATGGEIFNTSARELYNKASLYIVPVVNPDGIDLVNGVVPGGKFLTQAQNLAGNYPNIPYPNGWKANINGVDLNLQYPANWERAKDIKFSQGFTIPGPRDFVGTAPLTEPEVRAVYNFTRNHDFRLTLSYHSQGEIIYWKYLDYEPENSRRIAEYFGEVSGYAVEETPYSSGFAGYKDWFIETYNRPGYTIEIGIGMSPLPLSQFAEIYKDNIGILVGGITEI